MEKRPQYLNEKQVSRITGLALPTLRNYRHMRKGPAYSKIGRCVRYNESDVRRFMESKKIETDE